MCIPILQGAITIAKGRYHEWLEQDKLILLQGWAQDGLTDEQIAHNIGITTTTLYDWKNKFPDFAKTLKKGKEVVDYAVQGALLKKALSGDTMAIMYWLNNRQPDKWRRRTDVNMNISKTPEEAEEEIKAAFEDAQANSTVDNE